MTDFTETFKEKVRVALENDVNLTFDFSDYTVTVNTERYTTKVIVKDSYIHDERDYSLNSIENIEEDILDYEKQFWQREKLASNLEQTEKVNGWSQVQPEESTVFLKFVNTTKSIRLKIGSGDKWIVDGHKKCTISEAKYEMVKTMQERDPLSEIKRKTAIEALKTELSQMDQVGSTISRRLAKKLITRSTSDGNDVESIDNLNYTVHLKNVNNKIPTRAENYLKSLNYDPIQEAINEKKKELVRDHNQYQVVADEI